MRNMTTALKIAAVLLTMLMLPSCGRDGSAINLKDFQDKNGEYVFMGLSWGMTPEEVAEKTGQELSEPLGLTSDDIRFDTCRATGLQYYGTEWKIDYQFNLNSENGLYMATIFHEDEPAKALELYEKLLSELEKIYGAPQSTEADMELPDTMKDFRSSIWPADTDEFHNSLGLTYQPGFKGDTATVLIGARKQKAE